MDPITKSLSRYTHHTEMQALDWLVLWRIILWHDHADYDTYYLPAWDELQRLEDERCRAYPFQFLPSPARLIDWTKG